MKTCERCGGTGVQNDSTKLHDALDKINAMPRLDGKPTKRPGLVDRRCVRCNGTKVEREPLRPIDLERVKARSEAFAKAGVFMPAVAALSEAAAEQYGDDFDVYFPATGRKVPSKEIL